MARGATRSDTARTFAVDAARIARDDNAEDIMVLDLRGVSPVTDYFVIATGTSDRQMRTVAQDIIDRGRKSGWKVWHTAGMERGDWIALDFVDAVIHLFDAELRAYYDLELIWGECPRVAWETDEKS